MRYLDPVAAAMKRNSKSIKGWLSIGNNQIRERKQGERREAAVWRFVLAIGPIDNQPAGLGVQRRKERRS